MLYRLIRLHWRRTQRWWRDWQARQRTQRLARAAAALRRYRYAITQSGRLPDLQAERRLLRRVYRAWRTT